MQRAEIEASAPGAYYHVVNFSWEKNKIENLIRAKYPSSKSLGTSQARSISSNESSESSESEKTIFEAAAIE